MSISKTPIDSETFGEGARHYFLDLLQASNNCRYLRITRSTYDIGAANYKRDQVIIFEEDLFFFVEALSMLLSRVPANLKVA